MQDIQKLAFVLVQTFNLYIENRIRIYLNPFCFHDIVRKPYLILPFDFHKTPAEFLILRIRQYLLQFFQICYPALANFF